jgi:hypothetical protein
MPNSQNIPYNRKIFPAGTFSKQIYGKGRNESAPLSFPIGLKLKTSARKAYQGYSPGASINIEPK